MLRRCPECDGLVAIVFLNGKSGKRLLVEPSTLLPIERRQASEGFKIKLQPHHYLHKYFCGYNQSRKENESKNCETLP